MATTVKEIIGSAYILLNNASEEELDLAVALTQYGITLSEMQHELISGYRNPEIKKVTFTITDNNQGGLPADFEGDVVLLRYNDQTVPDIPLSMLDEYKVMNQQAVAFYVDAAASPPTKKMVLSMPVPGTLEMWYEPRPDVSVNHKSADAGIDDAFKYFMATRLASNLINYVLYNDPRKEAARQVLLPGLQRQASYAKDLYIAAVNKSSNNSRPFARLPYNAR